MLQIRSTLVPVGFIALVGCGGKNKSGASDSGAPAFIELGNAGDAAVSLSRRPPRGYSDGWAVPVGGSIFFMAIAMPECNQENRRAPSSSQCIDPVNNEISCLSREKS
jgi:hypothetical protein